jgi:hypothetical protein
MSDLHVATSVGVYASETFGVLAFLSPLTYRVPFQLGLAYALDFWTAAGLLRLSEDSTWNSVLIAAFVIGVRKLATYAIHAGGVPISISRSTGIR